MTRDQAGLNLRHGGRYVTTTEANKAIVRRFFEDAWNQNKVSDLDEYVTADTVHHFGARIAKEGPNELRAVIKNWRAPCQTTDATSRT